MNPVVLIIEGDPWLGDHLQRSLERESFKVLRASHAYAAIDMIDSERPDAIVTGLLLSGTGALSLLHELQSYVDTANIPVVICNSLPNISLDELAPYGVKRIVDVTTMKPDDLPAAVRSILA